MEITTVNADKTTGADPSYHRLCDHFCAFHHARVWCLIYKLSADRIKPFTPAPPNQYRHGFASHLFAVKTTELRS